MESYETTSVYEYEDCLSKRILPFRLKRASRSEFKIIWRMTWKQWKICFWSQIPYGKNEVSGNRRAVSDKKSARLPSQQQFISFWTWQATQITTEMTENYTEIISGDHTVINKNQTLVYLSWFGLERLIVEQGYMSACLRINNVPN